MTDSELDLLYLKKRDERLSKSRDSVVLDRIIKFLFPFAIGVILGYGWCWNVFN